MDSSNSSFRMMSALRDSGAEISEVRSDLVQGLEVTELGKIKLRGIAVSSVSAYIIRLYVRLDGGDINSSNFIPITCAVCAEANDDLILTV